MLWVSRDDNVCHLADYPTGFRFQICLVLSWDAPEGHAWVEGFVIDHDGYCDHARQICVPFNQQRAEPLVPRGLFPDDEVLVGPPVGYVRVR